MIRQQFLDGARVVVDAISSPAVAAAWDAPSVLAEQTVGGLAGHLARGAVWVVGDYLDEPEPDAAMFDSADDYFAAFTAQRLGVAATGPSANAARRWRRPGRRPSRRRPRHGWRRWRSGCPPSRPDRLTVVAGGATMRLDDYLVTRVIEQVVHLDDLARSIGRDGFPTPDANVRLALATGAWSGLQRSGAGPMIRALFRDDAGALPVL